MEQKIKTPPLASAPRDDNKADVPSMSFRFGEETIDRLGTLSELLNKSMASVVKELIHSQFETQLKRDKGAVGRAKQKWFEKKKSRAERRAKSNSK
jgi:hypothetical protein